VFGERLRAAAPSYDGRRCVAKSVDFSDAAAAQELDCISNQSKVMPTPVAKSKFMIL
jgi:hypothetical protein